MRVFEIDVGGSRIKGTPVDTELGHIEVWGGDAEHRASDGPQARGLELAGVGGAARRVSSQNRGLALARPHRHG